MRTYVRVAEHVVKPSVDMFNAIAGNEMEIELFRAIKKAPSTW